MDKTNAFFLFIIVLTIFFAFWMIHLGNVEDRTDTVFSEACTHNDGKPLIVNEKRLCFSNSSVITVNTRALIGE